jgi:polysaccharide export outer membrane protein
MRALRFAVAALLTGLALAGCARIPPVLDAVPDPAGPYRLDSGDRLRVVVFGQDGLSNSYAVDTSGKITMPLIGAVTARGLTPAEVSNAVAARLQQGYVREPHVAVEVESYRPFFVLGEVLLPGQFPYVPNLTAEGAVAIAGGFSPRALRGPVEMHRPSADGMSVGTVPLNFPVRPGDTIVVAERWF